MPNLPSSVCRTPRCRCHQVLPNLGSRRNPGSCGALHLPWRGLSAGTMRGRGPRVPPGMQPPRRATGTSRALLQTQGGQGNPRSRRALSMVGRRAASMVGTNHHEMDTGLRSTELRPLEEDHRILLRQETTACGGRAGGHGARASPQPLPPQSGCCPRPRGQAASRGLRAMENQVLRAITRTEAHSPGNKLQSLRAPPGIQKDPRGEKTTGMWASSGPPVGRLTTKRCQASISTTGCKTLGVWAECPPGAGVRTSGPKAGANRERAGARMHGRARAGKKWAAGPPTARGRTGDRATGPPVGRAAPCLLHPPLNGRPL